MFSRKKEALAAQAGQLLLEQLPVDVGKLQKAARFLTPKNLKLLAVAAVGGSAVLSVVGTLSHDRLYQAAVARELKKQLEPIHKQLNELSAQNEELRRQNEQLQKQLAQS